MKKLFKNEQSGRSMVEMLGVLAIIGVLSVAGIAGYSKAMAKYKQQKLGDQISTLTANIRTMFATEASYKNLTDANLIRYNIVPADMIASSETGKEAFSHALGGAVTIKATDSAGTTSGSSNKEAFTITFSNIDRDTCVYLGTADWGFGASGLRTFKVGTKSNTTNRPWDLSEVYDNCTTSNEIAWTYQ